MKICILTVYDAPNCGSFLQAYSTKCILEKNGYEVSFVKYRNKFDRIKLLFANEKSNIKHPLFYIKRGLKYWEEQKQMFSLISLKEVIQYKSKLIIGSDELWNIRNDKYFSKDIFYGKGTEKEDTLVLAVSCNEAEAEDFSLNIKNLIRQLPNVTYRDKHTGIVLKQLNVKAKFCCDPTIIAGKNMLNIPYSGVLPEKYMLVYAYHVNRDMVSVIKDFSNNHKLKIISMCSAFSWADINLVCSPLFFSDIVNKAVCVISGTFHGCVFSILNNKKFICIKDTPKIVDLLERYMQSFRIIRESTLEETEQILERQIDWNETNQLLSEDQKTGLIILKEFLTDEK